MPVLIAPVLWIFGMLLGIPALVALTLGYAGLAIGIGTKTVVQLVVRPFGNHAGLVTAPRRQLDG